MRLSDIKGERTLEVIAEIIDPIANIAENDAAKMLFRKEKLPDGMSAKAFAVKRIRAAVPKLLKENKDDIITILATISGKTFEEYAAGMNLVSLTVDLIQLINDKAFVELFMQAQIGESSGSAPENIEGR